MTWLLSLPSRLKLWALALVGGALVLFGAYRKGKAAQKAEQAAETAEAEREAHERINQADTGAGLSDGERVERLREFAAKHGNRPPKARR